MSQRLFISIILLQSVTKGSSLGTSRVDPRVDPLVVSKVGLIRGVRASDGDYAMFLGIPYAKVDENNLFGDSIPYPNFEETLEALDDSAICPQLEESTNSVVGTLDCLHLNVFVPTSATSNNRLPVLVWIHGGSFQIGSFNRYIYGPKFLVRHGIVLVTINYRLGPYGFMCPGISEVPGNQGLKDQFRALRWVKENVEAFGGDANRITIFGESAGAASVDLHLYTTEENLFDKAILQSGVSLSPWVMYNPGIEGPLKLAAHLGLVTDDVKNALSFLSKVDTRLVIAASDELGLFFSVCVEKDFEDVKNIVADFPVNLINVPNVRKIPILIGFNSDEELVTYANVDSEYFEKIDIVGEVMNETFDMDNQTLNEMSEILRHFYFGDDDINEETKRQVMDLSSDFSYSQPTQISLNKYFNNGAKAIFSYMFSYTGERNLEKYNNNVTIGGAAHADELGYLFDVSYMKSIMSEEEQTTVDRITTLWANFVKYGDPTPETTELLPVKWIPTTKDRWNYLNIDRELTLKTRPFGERMAFLDLFFKMNEQHQIGYHDDDDY